MAERKYWNEEIETMAPAALGRLEAGLLAEQMAYLHHSSPYFRAKFGEAGIGPGDIRDQRDLARLPFTEKSEFADAQSAGSLIGPHQCAPFEDIVRIVGTGGTTGQPLRMGMTASDVADYNEMGARALWTAGCRPGDLVVSCLNYSLYAGGVSDHMTFETMGAAILPYGIGNSKRLLAMLAHMDANLALYATPSYAIRLAELAAEEGIDPASLGLAKGFFSGEAGMQVAGYRARIEQLWGLTARDIYGTSEGGVQSAECEAQNGLHYTSGGLMAVELIEPESGDPLDVADGVVGEMVYTSLKRRACPLLRMRSHDLVRLHTGPCVCGRSGFRFVTLGRSDDMFIVKGVNVFPLAVQAVLAELQPRLTGEFEIILDHPPPTDFEPRLRVEVARDVDPAQYPVLGAEVASAVRTTLGFSPAVEFADQGDIASAHKTRRVLRPYRDDS
jgi:phenylacetate-CoA ligase